MNSFRAAAVVTVLAVAGITLSGRGQSAPPAPPAPAGMSRGAFEQAQGEPFNFMLPPALTKLEAFAGQRGAVITKGFTDIGVLFGDDASQVNIAAVQMSDGTTKVRGVAVQVSQPVEGQTVKTTAYVDEEELEELIAAVESLSKLQEGAAAPLQQFEARFQTRGALELTHATVNGGRQILVQDPAGNLVELFQPAGR